MSKYVKFTALILITVFCITSIVSCGPSQAKIDEVQTKYAELVTLHNDVVELCKIFDITDEDEIGIAVNEYADLLNSINDEELDKYTNDELDGFINDLKAAIDAMTSAKAVLQDLAEG